MFFIRRLIKAPHGRLEEIISLLRELSSSADKHPLSHEDLEKVFRNKNFRMFGAFEGDTLVGFGTIFFQQNLLCFMAEIHDVVISSKMRGKGVGEIVVSTLIEECRKFGTLNKAEIRLSLTSAPKRVAANKLYRKLGFILSAEASGEKGTNLYKMTVAPS